MPIKITTLIQRQAEEEVLSKPLDNNISSFIQGQAEEEAEEHQRQVGENEEVQKQSEEVGVLQTKRAAEDTEKVKPFFENRINRLKAGGQPLSEPVRAFFEPRFGADFRGVQVHAEKKAAETARALNAQAFTVGRDIVFGAGQYSPETTKGRKLLAHELTHVVQQDGRSNQEPKKTVKDFHVARPFQVTHFQTPMIARQSRYYTPEISEVVGDVIDAMSQSAPGQSAGVSDIDKAYRILNGLSMPRLLSTLTKVHELGHVETLLGYIGSANDKVVVGMYATLYQKEKTIARFRESWFRYVPNAISRLGSHEQNEVENFLASLDKHKTMTLLYGEGFEEERPASSLPPSGPTSSQPQPRPKPSQHWSERVRAVKKLSESKGIYAKEVTDVYVALIAEALNIGPEKVHVATSKEHYRPGVINFDPFLKGTGQTRSPIRAPLKRSDPMPVMPFVVIGPNAFSDYSPIKTQATVLHERTHESHQALLIEFAKKWKKTKYKYFEQWIEHIHRKKQISDENYYLIKEMFTGTDIWHGGISEIWSSFHAFTGRYHAATIEHDKEWMVRHHLNSMAYEISELTGDAKQYHLKEVSSRLLQYYKTLDEAHRRTFDSVLDQEATRPRISEGHDMVYSRWRKFRSKSP